MSAGDTTVFIIGAGAHYAYGFPLGGQLLDQIDGHLAQGEHRSTMLSLGFSEGVQDTFRRELRRSHAWSIDQFLEFRPEFLDIGRTCIATILLPCEREEKLRPDHNRGGDWCQYVFRYLLTHEVTEFAHHARFITFNYDRFLEHYLYSGILSHYSDMTTTRAMEILNRVKIKHVYGQLGSYGFDPTTDTPYGIPLTLDQLRSAAQGISLATHRRVVGDLTESLQHWLSEAKHVVFLGFGWDEFNLQLLGPISAGRPAPHGDRRFVWGSAKGLLQAERKRVVNYFNQFNDRPGVTSHPPELGWEGDDCLVFLRRTCADWL